jgi:hypothetical protein
MLSQYSFKRSYLLAGVTVVLTLLSIRFAIWNTFQAWKINKQLTNQMEQASNLSFQPGYLERKNKNLDTILRGFKVDTVNYHGVLLSAISSIAEQRNIRIVGLPDASSNPYYCTKHFAIQKIELEGSFADLTRFYHQLENEPAIGKVRAAHYTLLNLRATETNNKILRLSLFIEISSS